MANRRYYQFQYSLEPSVVHLFARVTIGATGAPTLDSVKSRGIASISRTSAGLYKITLSDTYNRLLQVSKTNVNATAPASPAMYVTSETVSNVATPVINLQMNAAGTATDPGNGEEIRFHIVLKNSNV